MGKGKVGHPIKTERIREMELAHIQALDLEEIRHKNAIHERIIAAIANHPDMPYIAMILGGGFVAWLGMLMEASTANATKGPKGPGQAIVDITKFMNPIGFFITETVVANLIPGTSTLKGGTRKDPWGIVGDLVMLAGISIAGIGLLILVLKYLNLGGLLSSLGSVSGVAGMGGMMI